MIKVFIVNDKAGHGKSKEVSKFIYDLFRNDSDTFIINSSSKQQTIQIAKNFKFDNVVVYSVGGDGTLNDIINGLAGGNAYLGIIPCGSGNDFIRNISSDTNEINLGLVNNRYFINVISFGIDAEVANKVNELNKYGRSKIPYPRSIATVFPKYKPENINLDGIDKQIIILSICNGSYYGNGIPIAPAAIINDNLLDLYLVEKTSKLEMLHLFSKLLKGKHVESPKVQHQFIKNLKINSLNPIICNIDGEIIVDNNFDISLQKNTIHYYQEDNVELKKLIVPYMKKF